MNQPSHQSSAIYSALALAAVLLFAAFPMPAQETAGDDEQRSFPAQFDHLGVERGDPDAALVVREFADYQCPACRSFYPTAKRLMEEYVDTGDVRFILFDFPLRRHQHAVPAAEAARCAGRQDAYWPMHNALFENQDAWSKANDPVQRFGAYASELSLDADALIACVESERTREAVMQSRSFALQIGVRSTPTVVVGNKAIEGAPSWPKLRQLVEDELDNDTTSSSEAATEPQGPDRGLRTVSSNRMAEASSPVPAAVR